jgi:hypothetical protein
MPEDRWQNTEVTIIYPSPSGAYDLYQDPLFDSLAESVYKAHPDAVMSSKLIWSDEDEVA